MINEKNLEKAKMTIKKENYPIIVLSQNDDYNRKIIEYGKFNILIGLESNLRKRSLRNIDSGLNEVLAKIMSKNKISLGIDLNQLRELNLKEKAEKIIQIKQNIKIARKSRLNIKLIGFRDKLNTISLMKSLCANSKEACESLDF